MFNFFKRNKHQSGDSELKQLIISINEHSNFMHSEAGLADDPNYVKLKSRPKEELKQFLIDVLDNIEVLELYRAKRPDRATYNPSKYEYFALAISYYLLRGLLKSNLEYTDTEWILLFDRIYKLKNNLSKYPNHYFQISSLPLTYAIKQLEYTYKNLETPTNLKEYIRSILKWPELSNPSNREWGSNLKKCKTKLRTLINEEENESSFELPLGDIGKDTNELKSKIKSNQSNYNVIFNIASSVTGSKPSKKFEDEIKKQINEIGINQYKKTLHSILAIPLKHTPVTSTHTSNFGNHEYTYTHTVYLSKESQNFIKGLVWTCIRFSDKETLTILTKLTEKCFTKIPGKGPAAASVGNACVYILGNMRGKDGLGALSRLKLKVRQNNVKKTIDKYLSEGAKKYDVSVEELKEMAVPDYGLVNGQKRIDFDDYTLTIALENGKAIQKWQKPDGSIMKSVPTVVKNSATLKGRLQKIRKEVKEIQKVFSAQKQRVDNQFILDRSWDLNSFEKYYLNHGLLFPITTKLIWTFKSYQYTVAGIYNQGNWESVDGVTIDWIDEQTTVKLWHPIYAQESEVIAWREKIVSLEFKQPFKQAYREIYLITGAEINTKTYSNRMAAHILKQHQFSTLANLRNWKYSLMGWYDDGRSSETCTKYLPEHKITVEYWIDELNQQDAFNDAGIWHYIATDQVKFKNEDNLALDLVDIPRIVFSEIMRDVDLFVGVCSVGNDPQWIDNNGDRQTNRDYWHSYSFGDLSEVARIRKEILANLLPKLKKIRDKATIQGNFLIVKGQLRTYKIHIGSGNILMEPNDQYLCIVPSRSDTSTNKLYIPFEGDRGLSIVLSKAFLLAEDHKVEDPVIVSQIKRAQ